MHRALLLVGLLAGCGDGAVEPDAGVDDGPDAAPAGQGSEPTSDLLINEVSPRGVGPDWVELHNRGAEPIDLCGYFLTDAADRLDHYLPLGGALPPDPCEPLLLAPGGYRIIELDGTPLPLTGPIDPLHAPFKLAAADEVHLLTTSGASVDGLLYLYPRTPSEPADVTLARVPDATGLFFAAPPTPASANPEVAP